MKRASIPVLLARDTSEAGGFLTIWREDASLILKVGRWESTYDGRDDHKNLSWHWQNLSVAPGTYVRAKATIAIVPVREPRLEDATA